MTPFRMLNPVSRRVLEMLGVLALLIVMATSVRAEFSDFVGTYTGSAEITSADGTKSPRDMNVEISETRKGFRVMWTSVSFRGDGSRKEKSYTIDFVPSDRDAVFAAAMRKNVFGHEVQLNPMKGEPYVWSRITGDTLTVYSLFVGEDGGYNLQQYDRTVTEGGLDLRFQMISDGEIQRAVETFLKRQ